MKRVLITGKKSYIGNSLVTWLERYPERYVTELISLRTNSWREKDFSQYDVVIHVAGIAHIKETKKNSYLYYKVNRDLAYEVAKKAKQSGVKQFIFFSSMSVYGMDEGIIKGNTLVNPKSNYGKSKLEAEKLIQNLTTNSFLVAIIRPPMVYGYGCKGNYQSLSKVARKMFVFPYINNRRSMIFINNLTEFVKLLIDDYGKGTFFPQNKEYVCTSELVQLIAKTHGKKVILTKIFNVFLKSANLQIIKKVFGDLVYDQGLSSYNGYEPISLQKSIELTEQ
ncbi:NAD-dependent epimerase/dehydratase family protein [Bacillus sp. B-jedd]|uniref:NAD-dependent epimerase/dehydratase family protein n=1 Tax=Bacillus sp. B-jedd TaxID=1476857 RepID=UPI00051570C6|nr:NAD-dependent epimerase/dehydratase family protein [Bacillus sp. B-jedd]CEG29114.1 NAD-dependent epimerase/dehydratase [Bacillus sp. B-jedd]